MTAVEYQIVPVQSEDELFTPNTNSNTNTSTSTSRTGNGNGRRVSKYGVEQDEMKGYGLMILSVLFGSLMRISTHSVMVYNGMSLSSLLLVWGIVQVLLALISIIFIYGIHVVLPRSRYIISILTIRAIFGAFALYLLQSSYSLMPVGGATAIFYVNPTFTLVLAFILLGEPVSKQELSGAVLSLLGVLLIASPWKVTYNNAKGIPEAIAAAALAACAYTALRAAACQGAHHMAAVLAYGSAIIVVGVISSANTSTSTSTSANISGAAASVTHGVIQITRVSWRTLAVALGGAAAGFASNAALSLGFTYCRAGTGALIRKADVGVVFALAALFLGEIPQIEQVLGATLIVGGTAIVALAANNNKVNKSMLQSGHNNNTNLVR